MWFLKIRTTLLYHVLAAWQSGNTFLAIRFRCCLPVGLLGVHQTLATPASSSIATPSTSAYTTPALKRFKFLSKKLQKFGSADDRSQNSSFSTCATVYARIDQYRHELPAFLPEEDAITFCRRRQTAYSLLAPLAQDFVAAPASQAYVERGEYLLLYWVTQGGLQK